ncbi:hypothetical protein [Bradyrhizobium zhanjiangense]|uniref:hypothetical protein n=1 Tax=Bradyrhizobium zhanjiangense TaxID=1325107 RepID=UPI0013E8ACA8|nr:hypothetical protein [Bradyrhizobium zhanjiangense]
MVLPLVCDVEGRPSTVVRRNGHDENDPIFEIIDHSDDDASWPGVVVEKNDVPVVEPKVRKNDMDDDIPF